MNYQIPNPIPISTFDINDENLEDIIRHKLDWYDTLIVEKIVEAVSRNTIALLPEWFYGAREIWNNDAFVLYSAK